jgi:hypothetical protein
MDLGHLGFVMPFRFFLLGAGAGGALARDEAPQRGAQSRE